MRLIRYGLLCSLLFIINSTLHAETRQITLDFFTTTLAIEYDDSILENNKHCTSTPCLKRFYRKLDASNFQVLLDNLQAHKEVLELNDWLYYQLVRQSISQLYPGKSAMAHTTTTWFFMTKSGYNTRLITSKSKYTFLCVKTNDKVYETSFVRFGKERFVNLTNLYYKINSRKIIFEIPRYQPGELRDKVFSFAIGNLPDIPATTIQKEYTFDVDNEVIKLNITVDTNVVDLMKNFPLTKPINYIQASLAPVTMASLQQELLPHLEGKSQAEQLSVIVSFTRKAFNYKYDQNRFAHDKPISANQLMLSDTSDHEDRVALLYQILKETTDLNFIVVQYIHDDIITIGVELPEVVGRPFEYEGIQYTICDPTLPNNSSKLGLYPISLDKDIEILDIVRRDKMEE